MFIIYFITFWNALILYVFFYFVVTQKLFTCTVDIGWRKEGHYVSNVYIPWRMQQSMFDTTILYVYEFEFYLFAKYFWAVCVCRHVIVMLRIF